MKDATERMHGTITAHFGVAAAVADEQVGSIPSDLPTDFCLVLRSACINIGAAGYGWFALDC